MIAKLEMRTKFANFKADFQMHTEMPLQKYYTIQKYNAQSKNASFLLQKTPFFNSLSFVAPQNTIKICPILLAVTWHEFVLIVQTHPLN